MRVAKQSAVSDFATSDLVRARPGWTPADLDAASQELDRAIGTGFEADRLLYYKAQIRELAGDAASAASWLDRMRSNGPGETVDTYDYERHATFVSRFEERTALLRRRELACPVIVTSLPGAGGPYLAHVISHLLGAFRVRTAKGVWGQGTLVPSWLKGILDAACVTQDQFPASGQNTSLITRHGGVRLSVLVRHPVDCLWTMHRDLSESTPDDSLVYLYARELGIPYFFYHAETPEARVDWLVRHVYPMLLGWQEGWLMAQRHFGERVAFARFEDMVANRPGMVGAVLSHAGYDPNDLPALDGGVPVPLDEAVARFDARLPRERGPGAAIEAGDSSQYMDQFSEAQLEQMARWNGSPVFDAFGYAPVDPGRAGV